MAADSATISAPRGESRGRLWIAVILLSLIGLAAATRRAVVLLRPASTSAAPNTTPQNPAAQLDGGFLQNRLRTFAHIVPAAIYLLLLPFQFIRRIRTRHPRFHRWNGRILVVLGIFVAFSALALSRTNSIAGINEAAAHHVVRTSLALVSGCRLSQRAPPRLHHPSPVDAPCLRRHPRHRHHASHRRHLLRHPQTQSSRILRNGLLARIHAHPDRGRSSNPHHSCQCDRGSPCLIHGRPTRSEDVTS